MFFLLILANAYISADKNADLLKELDKAIDQRPTYMSIKENRIDSLRHMLKKDANPIEEYTVNNQIYEEYLTYRYDSAMAYILKNIDIAKKIDNPKYAQQAQIQMSMLLSTGGLFGESINNIKTINRSKLDESLLYDYFSLLEWTYHTDAEYINDKKYTPIYNKISNCYKDSILLILPANDINYQSYLGKTLLTKGDFDSAEKVFLELYKTLKVDTRIYAIVTYNLAKVYAKKGLKDDQEKFLILAAISDQMCPLKENKAMQELAIFLYKNKVDDKNIDRAYKYIKLSMEDALFYNNRLRAIQISQKLPIILDAYQKKSTKETNSLKYTILIISFLSIIMIGLLIYIYRQMKTVKQARQKLAEVNEKLLTANTTKEKHIGLFIDLASSYIDKLNSNREFVKRKLQTNQIDDLYKFVNSSHFIDVELDEFFEKFDTSFLALFPTFIEDINKLFYDDQQIKLKNNKELNAELRIYALIRLGINDSAKIISFLRYSPQTVYNYRAKTKNRAKVDKENFEKYVMDIGSL